MKSVYGIVPGVYEIINLETGWRYVGSSQDVFRRMAVHHADLTRRRHRNRLLQLAWDDSVDFAWAIVQTEADLQRRLAREQREIDAGAEYNVARMVCQPGMRQPGVPLSLRHRRNISLASRGLKRSANGVANIRAAALRRGLTERWKEVAEQSRLSRLGTRASAATKRRLAAAQRRIWKARVPAARAAMTMNCIATNNIKQALRHSHSGIIAVAANEQMARYSAALLAAQGHDVGVFQCQDLDRLLTVMSKSWSIKALPA